MTHTIAFTFTDGSNVLRGSNAVTDDTEQNSDIAVAQSASAYTVSFGLTVSKLKSLFMVSDQAITVKTYLSGVLKDTISLAAGAPLVWQNGTGVAVPLSSNFDTIKIDGNADAAATLNIRTLNHETP